MTMLQLNDPLWAKLPHAFGAGDTSDILRALCRKWDEEQAIEFLFSTIIHQNSVYAATYAAAPHLLAMTDGKGRRDLAYFFAHLLVCMSDDPSGRSGLPQTSEDWAKIWEPYRADSGLANVAPPNEEEMARIRQLGDDFDGLRPAIGDLLRAAVEEDQGADDSARYLIAGLAALEGRICLAEALEQGEESWTRCNLCHAEFGHLVIGDKIGLYAAGGEADRSYDDWKDRRFKRAEALVALAETVEADSVALKLGHNCHSDEGRTLARHYGGSYQCPACGGAARFLVDA